LVPELKAAMDAGKPTLIEVATSRDPGQMLPKADARAQRC